MFRKMVVAIAATAAIGLGAVSEASARGGHGGGGHGGGHFGGGHFGGYHGGGFHGEWRLPPFWRRLLQSLLLRRWLRLLLSTRMDWRSALAPAALGERLRLNETNVRTSARFGGLFFIQWRPNRRGGSPQPHCRRGAHYLRSDHSAAGPSLGSSRISRRAGSWHQRERG